MFAVCETRNRLPNHDPSVAASTTVKTVDSAKTDNSRRSVYLVESLLNDLLEYKSIQDSISAQYPVYNPDGYVFCQENGDPYEPRTYQDLFKRRLGRPESGTPISTASDTLMSSPRQKFRLSGWM